MLLISRSDATSKIIIDDAAHELLSDFSVNEVALYEALLEELSEVAKHEKSISKGKIDPDSIFAILRANTLYFFQLFVGENNRQEFESLMCQGLNVHMVEHEKKYTMVVSYPGAESVNNDGSLYNTLQ